MKAKIYINYKDGILDPEGSTVSKALESIGITGIENLAIGKCIELEFKNQTKEQAIEIIEQSCSKLLANPNTEVYQYQIIEE
tara:strand:- start:1558 stop:1803 length:246 start_codon:yes stop_codon:yes gene_type:complete